jgi:hypothetical protein
MRDLLLRVSTRKSKKVNSTRRRLVKYAPVAQRRLAQHSCIPDAHRASMKRDKVTFGITRAKRLGKALNTEYKVFL